jgi:hypothetical protein
MAWHVTEPRVIERCPYIVVGAYAVCEGDDEPWGEASEALSQRKDEVPNRVGDALLAFLYRPHKDDPSIAEDVRACFMGVEVSDDGHVPGGMTLTQFSGGKFVTVNCVGDTKMDAAMAVGPAINQLEQWIPENGYREGDACFCFSREEAVGPPFVQHVYIKLEEAT